MKIIYFRECSSDKLICTRCNESVGNWLKLKNAIVLCQICEVKVFVGE